MRTIRTAPVLFLLLVLVCCRGGGAGHAVDLRDIPVDTLKSEILPTDEELLAPRNVFAPGGCLALFESRNSVGFLRFVDKRSGRLLAAYGTVGKAEGEFLQPKVFASGSRLVITSLGDRFVTVEYSGGRIAERIHPLAGEDA